MGDPKRTSRILANLDPDQQTAVTAGSRPLLVAAGPGTGKTRVLTHRIAWLIQTIGIEAGQIVALTFTNAAAREMGERLHTLIGGEAVRCRLSTIHALAARLVRAHPERVGLTRTFTILDQAAQLKLAETMVARGESEMEPAEIVRQVALEKSRLTEPAQLTCGRDQLARTWRNYDRAQREANSLDFEGLIVKAIELLSNPTIRDRWRRTVRAVLVDEFQDVSEAQFELLKLLTDDHGHGLTVIGDEDQSLYSWRGASTGLLTRFEQHFPGECRVINLGCNYRSTEAIMRPARRLIEHNPGRRKKRIFARRRDGISPIHRRVESEATEALEIVEWARALIATGSSAGELAVLMRVRSLPLKNELERALAGAGIRCRTVGGGNLWERSEIHGLLAVFHLLVNERNAVAFARVFEQTEGLGPKATLQVLDTARRENLTPLQVCREGRVDLGPKRNRAAAAFVARHDRLTGLRIDRHGFAGWAGRVIAATRFPDRRRTDIERTRSRDSAIQLYRAAEEFEMRCHMEGITPDAGEWLNELSLHSPQTGREAERMGVTLATIHASKGLEFSHVWLAGFDEGVMPFSKALREGGEQEERRLAYVAMTRAKDTLTVSSSECRRGQKSDVSRFLAETGLDDMSHPVSAATQCKVNTDRKCTFGLCERKQYERFTRHR